MREFLTLIRQELLQVKINRAIISRESAEKSIINLTGVREGTNGKMGQTAALHSVFLNFLDCIPGAI